MKFEIGDAVVHPTRGAGIVTGIKELRRRGDTQQYYTIKMFGRRRTSLMIPIRDAKTIGLRAPVQSEQLKHVLQEDPETLPGDYRSRHQELIDKFQEGDILQVAEAVRDLAWRREQEDSLTQREKHLYRRGIKLLASEFAGAEGTGLDEAKAQIRAQLRLNLTPDATEGTAGDDDGSDTSRSVRSTVSRLVRIAKGEKESGAGND